MTILFTLVVAILGIIGGRYLFKHWINHLTIYCVIWGVLITFYEWKLLPYYDLIPLTWFFIISAFFSFLFGILTIISVRRLFTPVVTPSRKTKLELKIFADDGRTIKYAILLFSTIGIIAALQHWYVLINLFGSLTKAIINANVVYKLNTSGGAEGVIPYISNFAFAAVFLSGFYSAYKGKLTFLTFLPFVGVILKSLATVGRGSMLFALSEFVLTFVLFRYLLKTDKDQRFKISRKNAIVAFSILLIFFVVSASLVKISRAIDEDLPGTSNELKELEDNFIISPSIYLYFSCDIGVLNQYLRSNGEGAKFGENTFWLLHYYLAKFEIIEEPSPLQKGYNIPMWINTGTYIRELHADFGITGVYLAPYLLGLIITWLWFKFYEQHGIVIFALLIYATQIIVFSFLMMITRLDIWGISIIIVLFIIPVLEKIANKRYEKSMTF